MRPALRAPNFLRSAELHFRFRCYRTPSIKWLLWHGNQHRAGERISLCLAESTVNTVTSKRFTKRPQMQWTRRGAHLLQARTRTLDGTPGPLFERWHPGLANDNGNEPTQATAA